MANEHSFEFSTPTPQLLFGENNANIKYLEDQLDISISDRGNTLIVNGATAPLKKAQYILEALSQKTKIGEYADTNDIDAALRFWNHENNEPDLPPESHEAKLTVDSKIVIKTKKKSIAPRSPNQARYVQSITEKEMVFGLGPAGTGKTYLAVAAGVSMYLNGQVERLIFTRPAVEAGENLGFLPGDMQEKISPYLRPIYDAMHDMLPMDFILKKMEDGDFEIAPLAFMRGRTLANAFVVLDEGQNTTSSQMKMFLTRMGEASRMVITGDPTQTDLHHSQVSGLKEAIKILKNIKEIDLHYFDSKDVVRHRLVGKIIDAYDHYHKQRKSDDAY